MGDLKLLPYELISAIYEFLYLPREILRFSFTCKYINTLVPKYLITYMGLVHNLHTSIKSMRYQQTNIISIRDMSKYTTMTIDLRNYTKYDAINIELTIAISYSCRYSILNSNKIASSRWISNTIKLNDVERLLRGYN